MSYRHGLVVGKFYPPHAGHHALIDHAAARCAAVTVVVAPSRRESIPLDLRVRWLEEAHGATPHVRFVGRYDDHPIDYDDPAAWDVHCALFREAAGDAEIDAVFSSEAYGPELARRFDATHVPFDPDRGRVPVSGTAVRADPAAHWSALTPQVRAWFVRRVVVVGAESTGTTTVARALAEWFDTTWVPEYGRELTERKLAALGPAATVYDVTWDEADFVEVAHRQEAAADEAARASGALLICDTDARATEIWEERYLGKSSEKVRAAARWPDLYLLTDHEGVPFEQDGLRDGEHVREWMTGRFRAALAGAPVPVVELAGSLEERLAAARDACTRLLNKGWNLAEPL
ncbi:transcriptional regulator NadR [Asanoa ishikariensis]|uniref:Nicotinamide-nucleotide adenylyltransferase, NadR type n=1 Tax=Asanoa ishikariensis TaxID=137265 RepID=A0A1H3MFC2_9ACTN|nr:AAA family ATPase [Asanoa ishikariensis]GIF66081.1 transcriptional regulator NadR [Asanoa ishikariensis]SDY75024.1 nicotinamide-nucleotide adenylyltransferase, NadR type [Asanoa ishikariensis]